MMEEAVDEEASGEGKAPGGEADGASDEL
jgi:hypothetical protein